MGMEARLLGIAQGVVSYVRTQDLEDLSRVKLAEKAFDARLWQYGTLTSDDTTNEKRVLTPNIRAIV